MKYIDIESLDKRMTYGQYLENMAEIDVQGTDHWIGYNQALVDYNRMNIQRMARWNKKLKAQEDLGINKNLSLLVITEGWCGDAAHVNPVIHQLSESSDQIDLYFIHRDLHLDIMDAFLTNGGRSIPKAILLDGEGKVLGSWGPRPKALQDLFLAEKEKGELTNEELKILIQKWYNKDKGQTTMDELKQWVNRSIGVETL